MLTPEQIDIANHKTGHAKVLATAGSGKTTVMVSRIQNLIGSGVKNNDIVSVMFNREACDQFKSKLVKIYHKEAPPVFTFHGIGSVVLNELVSKELLPKAKLETSEYVQSKIAREALDRWAGHEKSIYRIAVEFVAFVDLCKSSLSNPIDVFIEYGFPAKYRYFTEAFKVFENKRKRRGLRFFGDLIFDPVMCLLKSKSAAESIANRFEHIIIDEGQDISEVQQKLIELLAGTRASVMIVADDDQCIYTWRGAKPEYLIDGFDKVFKNAKTYFLRRTFRYGHQISVAANHLIKNNHARIPKLCISSAGTPATQLKLDTEIVGQPGLPAHISEWVDDGGSAADIAVLVRSYSQAVPIELALLKSGQAYRLEGGTSLFESADIGAIICGLHVANKSFHRLSGSVKVKMASMFMKTPSLGLPFSQEREIQSKIYKDPEALPELLDDVSFEVKEKWMKERLLKRSIAWRNVATMGDDDPLTVVDYLVENTGVKHHIEYVAKTEEDAEEMWRRYECVRTYIAHSKRDLRGFMGHVEDLRSSHAVSKTTNAITIMSVHRSKGLEFPFVIMPGLSQGRFPLIVKNATRPCDIQDERRLFFVAMTRAKNKLLMIAPNDTRLARYLGYGSDQPPEELQADAANASQFLYECNLFLSMSADKLVKKISLLPHGVKSPDVVVNYVREYTNLAK
jgi:DNA helicase-2/ATP-dependent DNA helicase PcrA